MTNTRWFISGLVAALTFAACSSSKDNILSVRDGAADSVRGSGGSTSAPGTGGTPLVGTGGSTVAGTGGSTLAGSGGKGGGQGGAGGGAVADSGGTDARDAASDAAIDSGGQGDALDAAVQCGPGYPVGSSRPAGDGCNTCTCLASGSFLCTKSPCPAQDGGMDTTTVGSGGSSGEVGGGGSGGSTGTGGAGGAGGSTGQAPCPSTPPQSGAACTSGDCAYENCAGEGRTAASCRNGAWVVETAACDVVTCGSVTCAAGQICLQQVGGALISSCVQNTCGSAPIACSCLGSCVGTCSVLGSTAGTTVTCSAGCTDPRGCP
jgi:hypothetical protein